MLANRNGIREWLFQRFSNVVIILAGAVYIINLAMLDQVSYEQFMSLHSHTWFKVVASVVFAIAMLNSLLAGWQIGTDYTQKIKLPGFGKMFHTFYTIGSIAFLGAAFYILWGL